MKIQKGKLSIVSSALTWIHANKDVKNDKLKYWAYRNQQKIDKAISQLGEEIHDIDIELALTDSKTGELLKDEKGNYKFNKENQLKRTLKIRDLLSQEAEIDFKQSSDLTGVDLLPMEIRVELDKILFDLNLDSE